MADTGVDPLLIPVNAGMLPIPLAEANPIPVLLLVQLYIVPGTAPENVTAVVVPFLHTAWSGTASTVGVGLTLMVNIFGVPVHDTAPFVKVGVTVIVAVTGAVPILTAVNEGRLPDVGPAGSPTDGLSFVQE